MKKQKNNQTLITQKGDSVILESDVLRVTLDPKNGGKIRSFFSKSTDTEFFYQDANKPSFHENYSDHDMSGFDECFPSVADCKFPSGKHKGISLGDHGYLWRNAWKTQIKDDAVFMSKDLPLLNCAFERTCKLQEPGQLRLDYKISNYGSEPIPFIYSAHPLLRADEHTELILPEEVKDVYIYLAGEGFDFCNNTWVDFPFADNSIMQGPFMGAKNSYMKFFTKCSPQSRAILHQKDTGQSLQFQFDTNILSCLGVLVSNGYVDGEITMPPFLALEPTTGIGDELATCQSTQTLRQIKPGQEIRFWTTLTLDKAK